MLAAEGLTLAEYALVCERLGREPNRAELGMFGVMWSEHCCYKNSRPLLKQFPTTGSRVLAGPGENAGVLRITEELVVCFKIESHNRPSAVEPYQGAATGVGGILRDIFTMGARPIALLNSLRFGSLEDPWVRGRVAGVVGGIAGYGNCVGVPTVGGEVYFDPVYARNPLVNAMAIGLLETPTVVKSGAAGVGNPIVYVGSTTGRDGIKGASFASAELSAQSERDRPAVQVGDPFLEKLLIEACLEAFKTGAVVAAQDMGAAGLTCATSEMAAKGGVGAVLDLDKIPARAAGMTPYEYLLSESQERMLLVVQRGREEEVMAIFHRWGLQAVVAGEIVEGDTVTIWWRGEVAAQVPARALAEDTPVYGRSLPETPEYAQRAWAWSEAALADRPLPDPQTAWRRLLQNPSIASKAWIYRQYDSQVQNNTVRGPGAEAAVIRLRPQPTAIGVELPPAPPPSFVGLAATVDANGRYVYLDPYEGAKLAVAEAARNLSCVGALPLAVTDNLNFASPEKPVGYWQLHEACRGIAEACRELDTPVTGGNVSLYNEKLDAAGNAQPIYPTPVIGMVGLVEDVRQTVGGRWQTGDTVYLLGGDRRTLGASEYLAWVLGEVTGRPMPVDFAEERAVQALCREAIARGWVTGARDRSEGGLAILLAEFAIAGGVGATVSLPAAASPLTLAQDLFGEGPGCIVLAIGAAHRAIWEHYLDTQTVSWRRLGEVGGDTLTVVCGTEPTLQAPVAELRVLYEGVLPGYLGE